ncbi:hypothetical protein [Kangiella sediminilitoris]|nr:hypothetical protein [Kangiella sediminilitoris]
MSFLMFFWHEKVTDYQQQAFSKTYNQGLADSTAAFLGQLIDEDRIEAISKVVDQLEEQPSIQSVTVYQRTGELIHSAGNKDNPHSDPVIANISFNGTYNGYLIVYFKPGTSLIADQDQLWVSSGVIWLLGALIWSFLFFILNIKRWFRSSKKSKSANTPKNVTVEQDNSKLLKQLMKRNLKQSKDTDFQCSLVIKANWTKLNNGNNNKLLKILSRWLPQNGLVATQFNNSLLVLGLDTHASALSRNPLYALEQSLKSLQLEPKIIIHDKDFDKEIYQTLFKNIEAGIWYEKTLHKTHQDKAWPADSLANIEFKENQFIELCQLPQPDAQQISLIERQVRFISDD